ncbi:MAG: hypothetical protein QNJ47_05500 [Nostocaceae cyanobacterium]|nr:hypothetical protein [Nostocaceae cyanobacterium]
MVTAASSTALNVIINPCAFSFANFSVTIILTTAIVTKHRFNRLFNFLTKLNQDYKVSNQWGVVNRKKHFHASYYGQFMRATYIFIGTFLVINSLSKPAQAQFFQNAETWMTAQFTGAGEAIPLVFNVLRGLFLLYLGISLVKVIQAARQDEDWQNLARTPMIILIAITMGDILANLIIGGGGA